MSFSVEFILCPNRLTFEMISDFLVYCISALFFISNFVLLYCCYWPLAGLLVAWYALSIYMILRWQLQNWVRSRSFYADVYLVDMNSVFIKSIHCTSDSHWDRTCHALSRVTCHVLGLILFIFLCWCLSIGEIWSIVREFWNPLMCAFWERLFVIDVLSLWKLFLNEMFPVIEFWHL